MLYFSNPGYNERTNKQQQQQQQQRTNKERTTTTTTTTNSTSSRLNVSQSCGALPSLGTSLLAEVVEEKIREETKQSIFILIQK